MHSIHPLDLLVIIFEILVFGEFVYVLARLTYDSYFKRG
jgi:hypothetical protein